MRIMAAAAACVGAGYPPDYSTMLRDLLAACKQSGGTSRRVDASSSHSVYRRLDVTKSIFKGRVNVKVGGMDFVISDMGVVCESHALGEIVVKGCSLGDGGVWLSVAVADSELIIMSRSGPLQKIVSLWAKWMWLRVLVMATNRKAGIVIFCFRT